MKRFIIGLLATATILVTIPASSAFAASAQAPAKPFAAAEWFKLSTRDRVDAVTSFIAAAKKQGVTIKKSPTFYAKSVDGFYQQHPSLKSESTAVVLKTLMIMEYDWVVAGTSSDQLARSWLGDDLYAKNKKRMGK